MRDRLARHDPDPACSACHHLMDALGLAFELFDDVGRVRAHAPDSSGVLTDSGDQDGPFADGVQLSRRLASSSAAEGCFARNAFRFWLGRDDRAEDACAVAAARDAYAGAGGDLLALVQGLYTSGAFLDRKDVAP
jgi:hypothetical protein